MKKVKKPIVYIAPLERLVARPSLPGRKGLYYITVYLYIVAICLLCMIVLLKNKNNNNYYFIVSGSGAKRRLLVVVEPVECGKF